MNCHPFLGTFLIIVALPGLWSLGAELPNIIILADDLGWADLGCYSASDPRRIRIEATANSAVKKGLSS